MFARDLTQVAYIISKHNINLKLIERVNGDIFKAVYGVRDAPKNLVEATFKQLQEDAKGAFVFHSCFETQKYQSFTILFSVDERLL